ncbi:hypothetical protein ESA94_08575 [Lacibacter luteus]|uniref:Uncharacterized protein n=1 Tax=Lacibacter luteus TaxID=2508719 RepID=A0A4Q1CIZ1_9BACT|nr:hypothetical protein [Lacibacter luteus]RXK60513.1 hypothetical protein ESA94_08575 [Lacibacter luteus]
MQKQVMALTRNLLSNGVFNHLSDAALSRMQWLLLTRNNSNVTTQLMQYWYSGNYFTTGAPQDLFHQCNLFLMQAGKPAIDVFMYDETEA